MRWKGLKGDASLPTSCFCFGSVSSCFFRAIHFDLQFEEGKKKPSCQRLEMKLKLLLVCPGRFLLASTRSSRERDLCLVSSSLLAKFTSRAHDLGGCVALVLKLPSCKYAVPHRAQQATDLILVKTILFLARHSIKMHSCTTAMMT